MRRNTILFDHDGVLVDTEKWYFEASRQMLERVGVALSREDYLANNAAGRSSWSGAREKGLSEDQIRELKAERNTIYQHALQTEDIEIPGVGDALDDLRQSGCQMAIITTARREDFELIHRHRGIKDFFDFVLCFGDYARPKPQPDPYLAGLERFGASKGQTLVVEDSQRGLRSAVAAGIDCVVVSSEFTQDQDFDQAWAKIDELSKLGELI